MFTISLPRQTTLKSLVTDARHFQIFFLGTFLTYGILALNWDAHISRFIAIFSACLLTQFVGIVYTSKDFSGLKSAFITSLSLSLMLQTHSVAAAALAGVLAIVSKFLIRFEGKHVFNPANVGIVLSILFTGETWISSGQWGSGFIWVMLVGITGLTVLQRVGRIDTGLTFLLVFGGLQFVKMVIYQGWTPDVWLHNMSSGTLLLFSFFMITDPVSTPNSRRARVIWSALIAILAYAISQVLYIYAAPIWALFFISPFTAWFDRKFIAKPFKWNKP